MVRNIVTQSRRHGINYRKGTLAATVFTLAWIPPASSLPTTPSTHTLLWPRWPTYRSSTHPTFAFTALFLQKAHHPTFTRLTSLLPSSLSPDGTCMVRFSGPVSLLCFRCTVSVLFACLSSLSSWKYHYMPLAHTLICLLPVLFAGM